MLDRHPDNDFEENAAPDAFDFDEAAELCGLSGLQRDFARAILKGANRTQAARAAGYRGSDEQLRGAGYKAYNSPKVQAFLNLAQQQGYGVPDEPGDAGELKRILWKHARGDDKAMSIRAAEVLHRLEANEAAAATDEVKSPAAIAQEILERKWGEPLIALMWSSLIDDINGSIISMPHKEKVLPVLKRDYPDVWRVLRDEVASKRFPEEVAKLDSIASLPVRQEEAKQRNERIRHH